MNALVEPPPPAAVPARRPDYVFPRYIRTKGEALALVADLFPKLDVALKREAQWRPPDPRDDGTPPFFYLEMQVRDDLQRVFEWLFEDHTRIYKRARRHLFPELAARILKLTLENREAIDRHWNHKHWQKEHERKKAVHVMTGDGQGI